MNLFYEELPCHVFDGKENIHITTDFRDIIRLIDMLEDASVKAEDTIRYILAYFAKEPYDLAVAIDNLTRWISADEISLKAYNRSREREHSRPYRPAERPFFSFAWDYPYIHAAFLQAYRIDIASIDYLHWWTFLGLFQALPADTELKKRMAYRATDLTDIQSKEERKRIEKIQREIALPWAGPTDYDIGDLFW